MHKLFDLLFTLPGMIILSVLTITLAIFFPVITGSICGLVVFICAFIKGPNSLAAIPFIIIGAVGILTAALTFIIPLVQS